MRRFFVPPFFGFDARVHSLEEIQDHWSDEVKKLAIENRDRLLEQLREEYGSVRFDEHVRNFLELGDSPMSIISYHNHFYHQARHAFVVEAYYPALTGACALGERILNHLIMDLRGHFRSKPNYKSLYRKESIDDWGRAIDALQDWGVLEPGIADHFQELELLRNRSIHFDPKTYTSARDDALTALGCLKKIVSGQFSAFGAQRWFIRGTKGACFIKSDAERDPFVSKFYLPQCPYVGYRYAVARMTDGAVIVCDKDDYGNARVTDDEFCHLLSERSLDEAVSTELPPPTGVMTWLLLPGRALKVRIVSRAEHGLVAVPNDTPTG